MFILSNHYPRSQATEEEGIPAPIENLSKNGKISIEAGMLSDIAEFFDIVHKQPRPVLSLTVGLSYPSIAWLLVHPLTASQPSSGTGVKPISIC